MSAAQIDRPSFFELYKEHCSSSDLGPISLNWFDELTAETTPYVPSTCDGNEDAADRKDENGTKTPSRKACTFSQLDSTPIIFKEDVLSSPLFLSPSKDSCRSISEAENNNTNIALRCPIQTPHLTNITATPSYRSLSESPIVLKELFKTPFRDQRFLNKTPQRDGKPDVYDSLFCTPKLMKSHALTISQSLGAEVDSEMSWTSSLATPPSPTVIIAKDNEHLPRSKIYDSKTAVIVQSLFSKRNNVEEENVLAVAHETSNKKELTPCPFNEGNANSATSSDVEKVAWKQTVANAVKDKEVCQTVENVLEGMEDVLSIFFTNERNNSLRKVRTGRVQRKTCAKTEFVIPSISTSQEGSFLIPSEKHFDLDLGNQTKNVDQDHANSEQCDTLAKEALPVYEWTQLNLCDLNTSQLEDLPSTHTQGRPCRDLEAVLHSADAVNAPNVHMSSRYVADVLTVEYTSTKSGKKVTVTKNSYVNLVNQSTVNQQEKAEHKLSTVVTESSDASEVQLPLTSNPALGAQSALMTRSSCRLRDESAHAVSSGANPTIKMLSTTKRQAKFLYCVTGTQAQQENGSRDFNSDDRSWTNKIPILQSKYLQDGLVLQANKYEFAKQRLIRPEKNDDWVLINDFDRLPENKINLSSMTVVDGQPYALESPCLMQTMHTDFKTSAKCSSVIKRKVFATADLLARKHLMDETTPSGQHGNQSPEPSRDVTKKSERNHNLVVTCGQNQEVQSLDSCNIKGTVGRNRVVGRNPEQPGCASLSSGEKICYFNPQTDTLPQRNKAVLGNESTGTENSTNICEPEDCSKKINLGIFNPNHSHADIFLNAIHAQTCSSECSETKRVTSILLDQNPSKTTFELSASIKGDQSGKQPSAAFNKIPSFSCDTAFLGKCFDGFKTASNREIQISEKNLMKGESLFKDIEAQCLATDTRQAVEDHRGSLEIISENPKDSASMMTFKGFKTAASKDIKVSESMFAKGRLLFRDIEDESSEAPDSNGGKRCGFDPFPKPDSNININTSEANCRLNIYTSESIGKASCEKIHPDVTSTGNEVCRSKMNRAERGKRQSGLPAKTARKSLFVNPVCLTGEGTSKRIKDFSATSPCHDALTESQKAEISELSSILECADSQYEFTQFRKAKPVAKTLESLSSLNDSLGESLNLNSSDVWRDVDFNDSFAAGEENPDVEPGMRHNPKIDPRDSKNYLEPSDVRSSLKNRDGFGGFSLASGKSINIETESLKKAAEMFRDLEESTGWIHTVKDDRKPSELPATSVSKDSPSRTCTSMNSDLKDTVLDSLPECHGVSELDTGILEAAANVVSNLPQIESPDGECVMSTKNVNKCVVTTKKSSDNCTACSEHTKIAAESVQPLTGFGNKGFQTASGKNITFLQSSLENAKNIFREDDRLDTIEVQCNKDKAAQEIQLAEKPLSSARREGRAKCLSGESATRDVMGFCTAGGKKVAVTADSLAKARKRFEKDDQLLAENNESTRHSNSQERRIKDSEVVNCGAFEKEMEYNKKSNRSEVLDHSDIPGPSHGDALLTNHNVDGFKSCGRLDFSNLENNPQSPPVFTIGFTTGKGKSINIDKASLLKARNVFSDILGMADVPVDDHHAPLLTRPHNDESKVNISSNDRDYKCESRVINDKVPIETRGLIPQRTNHLERTEGDGDNLQAGNMAALCAFSTASGKAVSVSHESYWKAKQMLSESTDNIMPGSEYIVQAKVANVSCQEAEVVDSTDLDASSHHAGHQPLMLSSESRPAICDRQRDAGRAAVCSYANAKVKTPSCLDQHFQSKDLEKLSSERAAMTWTVSFSTASGRSVHLSEESLKKAKEMFNDMDASEAAAQKEKSDLVPVCSKGPLKRDTHQSKVTEAETEAIKAKCPLNINADTNSLGFNTASGKKVCVSDSALEKVKGIFEEFDPGRETPAPAEENISNSITRKPKATEAFDDNLNHCQNEAPSLMMDGHTNGRFLTEGPGGHSTPSYNMNTSAQCSGTPQNSKLDSCFSTSHTLPNDYELEAAESARAFMDDEDLLDTEPNSDKLFPNSNKTVAVRSGKRLRSDDGKQCGEPPIKRQLLPEFDRATDNQPKSNLKPLTCSPNGTTKDRRKCLFNLTLQPSSCNPTSLLKGRKDNLVPKFTEPKQFNSTSKVCGLPHLMNSIHGSSDDRSHLNMSRTDTPPAPNRAIKAFVPPFKKLQPSSNAPMGYSEGHDQHGLANRIKDRKDYVKTLSTLTEVREDDSDLLDLVSNLCCARQMQEMRLRKKQRQKVKPQPGSLYLSKTSSSARIPLRSAVHRKAPGTYSEEQLYVLGVVKSSLGINSENARSFQFNCLDYFTKDCLLSENGVQVADGGWLIPGDNLKAGKEELYRALCDTPGVDPKLISPEWVYNHYRWIVWKLAALEVRFPEFFASRCLTPERVLLQLKYRYDVEIDKAQRSAIRKIMERDDTPAKTLVLCVARVISQGTNLSNSSSNKNESDSKQRCATVEVTDGWYGIKALLDPALATLLRQGKLFTGQKIIVHGAELVGSDDACTPLEAPESIMLKLSANSTRPVGWFAKLGYFRDPRPFCLPLASLYSEGGTVGCVDVLIQRIYPIQYMEKMANGLYVFRNERAEEKEAEKHSANQQKSLEILFAKIQAEFEQQEASQTKRRGLRRHSLNKQQICTLQDGAEIYEAIQAESDPSYLESCLSSEQRRALHNYRQTLNDKKQAQIQTEFRKAIESSEQGTSDCAKREVTPVWKLRIVDYRDQERDTAYTLSIWRPLPGVLSLLKEGVRFKIYNLATSQSKGKSDTADVQFTATKKTQFLHLQSSQDILARTYNAREATSLDRFLDPTFSAPYGEVDVAGLVISTYKKTGAAPIVYLSDETHNVLAVKFWTDLGQLALDDLTKPCTFIAASNLRWRSECASHVPTVYAGDLSTISSNPKEPHLQKPIQRLRHSIQSIEEFHNEAIVKLLKLLQVTNLTDKRSADYMTEPRTPTWKDVSATNHHVTPMAHSGKKPGNSVLTPDVNPTLPPCRNESDPKVCKQMRGLDYLSRIPSPPPITPVRSFLSPYLQRAFRPPRSSSAQHARTQVKGQGRDIKNAHSEGGFVADEELAMINTQALVSGLDQDKSDSRRETNATSLNAPIIDHLTGHDSPKPSSEKEPAHTLQSVSPTCEEHRTAEKDGPLLCRNNLQRKRKRKL